MVEKGKSLKKSRIAATLKPSSGRLKRQRREIKAAGNVCWFYKKIERTETFFVAIRCKH
jgi:hypothetical protein